ncbi:MAG: hypothetical protein KF886_05545 [Candidatus Hydrogenedentes bacterium]|nr:hypothetical protein [Candidatus Hydrogenedentota bacterium]
MSPSNAPEPGDFTHLTRDTVHGIAVHCSGPSEMVEGVAALRLGAAVFAPARALSITGEQIGIVLRICPQATEAYNPLVSKGHDQYRIYQPDPDHLCFQLRLDTLHTLTTPVPADWYGGWRTVVAAYTGAEMCLAVDGAVIASAPASGAIRYAPGAVALGFDPFTGARGRGAVAEVRFYAEIAGGIGELASADADSGGCAARACFDAMEPARPSTPPPLVQMPHDSAPVQPQPGPRLLELPPIKIHEQDNVGQFTGEGFYIEIDLPSATIVTWRVGDMDLIELGPVHQFWKPLPLAECAPCGDETPLHRNWADAGYAENLLGTTAMEAFQGSPHAVTLEFQAMIIRRNSDVLFDVDRRYTVFGNGEVLLEQTLTARSPLPAPGRAGMEVRALPCFDHLSQGGAPGGGTAWAALRDREGYGLLAWSDGPLAISAAPFSVFQRSEAHCPEWLAPDSAITLHLDDPAPPAAWNAGDVWRQTLRLRGLDPECAAIGVLAATGLPE